MTAGKMLEQDVKGVQRMLKFGQALLHEHLVPIRGHWEQDNVIYILNAHPTRPCPHLRHLPCCLHET